MLFVIYVVCDDFQGCLYFMLYAMILNPVSVYVVCDDPLILLKYSRMYDTLLYLCFTLYAMIP
jgi:hypothetical protein